jgi:hypothetical protein
MSDVFNENEIEQELVVESIKADFVYALLGDVRKIVKMYDTGELPIKFLSTDNLVEFIDIMDRWRSHVA